MELEVENNRRLFGKSLLEEAIFTWTRRKKKETGEGVGGKARAGKKIFWNPVGGAVYVLCIQMSLPPLRENLIQN